MIERLTVAGSLLFCLRLTAQDWTSGGGKPDVSRVYVNVRTSALGNVALRISSFDLPQDQNAAILNAVPEALACNWTEDERTEDSIEGVCRAWLTPVSGSSAGNLHLGSLVQALQARGAQAVTVYLDVHSAKHIPLPSGWETGPARRALAGSFTFTSAGIENLPPDVAIPLETAPDLIVPILGVLLVPTGLAYWIRLRATNAPAERKVNWIVWMNWINLGAWLFWISASNPRHIGESLVSAGSSSYIVALTLGALLYSLPPLTSQAACLLMISPLLSSSKHSFRLLLRRQLVGEASLLIPVGIFLVGSGLNFLNWGSLTLSLVAAYLVYRFLAWMQWSLSYGNVTAVESGELFERASGLARKAGVTLARLSLLRTRVPEEANAFATPGDTIILTESLVKGLTGREVDAVIAHELGHHKSGHLRFSLPQVLFWMYIIVAGPLLGWLTSRFPFPSWVLTIPIAPLLFMTLQGLLSQRHELTADARAVEITGDPEGKIAALARLARLSRIPVQGGGIMASILSHPSMERRVLALARRFHVSDARALAILHNPDDAYAMAPPACIPPESIPSDGSDQKPLFTLREKAVYLEQLRWLHLLGPLAGACLIGAVAGSVLESLPLHLTNLLRLLSWRALIRAAEILTLLVAPFPLLALTLGLENLLWRRFRNRLRRMLAQRLTPSADADFAGIHPGRGVRYTEGFSDWDWGFVTVEGDWLCYRGERARFAISRQEVAAIRIAKGPMAWQRARRVEIVFRGGALTLSANGVKRTADQLHDWLSAATAAQPCTPAPEPPPLLPPLPGMEIGRLNAVWSVCKISFQLWFAAPLVIVAGWRSGLSAAVVVFVAPLVVLLRFLPQILWPIRRPTRLGDSQRSAQCSRE